MNQFEIIQNIIKCSKDKCKDKYDKVINDKNLIKDKRNLDNIKDLKKKEKAIIDIYSSKIQKDLDLCAYKKCNNHKKLHELKIKSLKDKIKVYNIKLSVDYQNKFNELIKLTDKPSLTDEEYLKYIILFQILQRFINNRVKQINAPFYKYFHDYLNCSEKYCKDLLNDLNRDTDLTKKKISIYSIKNDSKRNNIIKEVFSNENQVKLDKCITNKCNNQSLLFIKEIIKIFNKKIKAFDLKLPANLTVPNITTKITEKDIPDIIIRINQIGRYIDKYIGEI